MLKRNSAVHLFHATPGFVQTHFSFVGGGGLELELSLEPGAKHTNHDTLKGCFYVILPRRMGMMIPASLFSTSPLQAMQVSLPAERCDWLECPNMAECDWLLQTAFFGVSFQDAQREKC